MILVFDTATTLATCAVGTDDQVLASAQKEVTTHSEGLMQLIHEVLERAAVSLAQLDAIACGRGPGSYTGLRIGMATAKGLCFAAQKPLITISSLLGPAMAVFFARPKLDANVVSLLDARRSEVFGAVYAPRISQSVNSMTTSEASFSEFVCRPAEIAEHVPSDGPLILVGDGALRYREELLAALPTAELADADIHGVNAERLLRAASDAHRRGDHANLASCEPTYLRSADIRPSVQKQIDERALAREGKDDEQSGEPALSDEALIERLRQSGLRLDQDGRWWHEGQQVTHPKLALAFHRWLDQLDDGRYVIRLDQQRYAYVEVDDVPYTVRSCELRDGQVMLQLSDGSSEPLAPHTLQSSNDHAFYCRVKNERFEARFIRSAYYTLAEHVVETDDGFALKLGAAHYTIASRAKCD
jgi:tRNA threonylcarbamoyl adenosine modification protein YeaZ